MSIIDLKNIDIQFIGMYRSGNHAVIDWILAQSPSWTHYNNALLNVDQTAKTEQVRASQKSPVSFTPHVSLISFEDQNILYLSDHLGDGKRVLLLRDPFNLFASRFKNTRNFIEDENATFTSLDMLSCRAVNLWKSYAKAFLSGEYIGINFNQWYSDQEYRQKLSVDLELSFNDKGFGSKEGWQFSGGSSFEKPDVLNSWKHMETDEEFIAFFDQEMIELSQEIFGPLPQTSPYTQLALKPDLEYRHSVEKIVSAALEYCSEKEFEKANKLLFQAQKVFSSSRILQLIQFIKRDLFSSLEEK